MQSKKGKIIFGFLAGLLLVILSLSFLAKPIDPHPFFKTEGVLIMAHRGGRGLWPENTLYAFENAVNFVVDVLEMDVHSTRDGVIVVMHD